MYCILLNFMNFFYKNNSLNVHINKFQKIKQNFFEKNNQTK